MRLAAPGGSPHCNSTATSRQKNRIRQVQTKAAAVNQKEYPSLYIAKFPLEGFEAIENLPPVFSDPASVHVALIIDCSTKGVWLFDYLPENATDPLTIARIVANLNLGVPGQARSRKLSRLPNERRCSPVGASNYADDTLERARAMQKEWDKSELKLFKRDCRHFVDELVLKLTT